MSAIVSRGGAHRLRRPSTPATACSRRTPSSPPCARSAAWASSARTPRSSSSMGDKDAARRTMREAGVPVIPGCDVVEGVRQAQAAGRAHRLPPAHQGARGRRRPGHPPGERPGGGRRCAYLSATAEAQSAFGDGAVYMEKFLFPVKHIEMQILCDNYGPCGLPGRARVLHAAQEPEDCSRRAPRPAVTAEMRREHDARPPLAAKAVGLSRALGTHGVPARPGAGTSTSWR